MKKACIFLLLILYLASCRLVNHGTATPLIPSSTITIRAAQQAPTTTLKPAQPEPTLTGAPSTSFSPTPDPTSCIPSSRPQQYARVRYVFDGDTIEVDVEGTIYHVRYIGIDAPEDTRTIEYFGAEATERNRQLVAGKTITMVRDVSETDKYDRLLRYVLADGEFVNYALVAQGYAFAGTYPPDVACNQVLLQAERQAQRQNLGLWGSNATGAP